MREPDWFAAVDATWPAERQEIFAGFCLRFSNGGGSRVRAANLLADDVDRTSLSAVEQKQRQAGQPPLISVRPGQEGFDAMLADAGYREKDPSLLYTIDPRKIAEAPPPVTAFAIWPPLAIQQEVWRTGGIDTDRWAIMDRASTPKVSFLGRIDDKPAATGFVSIDRDIAVLHALEVLESFRRRGLARIMINAAADWALEQGALRLALLVTRANKAANALYTSMGFEAVGHYHYRIKSD